MAAQSQAWAQSTGVPLRDAIVLLPFAQLLPWARAAFAQSGGWMPRIETTQTWARALGPTEPLEPLQISFDLALDRLSAAHLLRSQTWVRASTQADSGSFDYMVSAVIQTAHVLARAAHALPPARREAHWELGRALLATHAGPGARERLLARVAFEWAAASAAPATDALFGLRASAWIAVQAGGVDALTMNLLLQADAATPTLWIDTDADADDPIRELVEQVDVQLAVCESFEAEAQRCAAQVLAHLAAHVAPVALIAQDRTLARRVRALLARQGVPLADETGWKLSTTRVGATLASLLRSAAPRSRSDDWLDWIKSCVEVWPGDDVTTDLPMLESAIRRHGWSLAAVVDGLRMPDDAARLWRSAQHAVSALAGTPLRTLGAWLYALRTALQSCGAWTQLIADDAGRQLLSALHLVEERPSVGDDEMTLAAFSRWVDAALESASFLPTAPPGSPDALVVITPLERAMLRPFAAIVFPGTDEKRLGAPVSPHPLLSDALAAELGLPDAAARRQTEALAFAQLLRAPKVTLLRRASEDGEPLAASSLLDRLKLALLQCGRAGLPVAADPSGSITLVRQGVPRPRPVAPALLPSRLSASACEALRACPYRFFALQLLRLRSPDELDDAVEKRDYGTWLHAVLHRFHRTRGEPAAFAVEQEYLHRIALAVRHEMALDDAAFLPFAASFARLVPAYLAWLHRRDAQGAQWLDGEVELSARPAEWEGIEMHGVIDRVDSVPGADDVSGPVLQLIDYKTGSAQGLREQLKQPQEDTQLAFYAALMERQSDSVGDIGACYLPLDEGDKVLAIEHRDVMASAQYLVEGLGHDLARLRKGAVMQALGEGKACEHCDARGLCRRDHWAVDSK